METPRPTTTLLGLQFYRGLAALVVVSFHATLIPRKYQGAPEFRQRLLGSDVGVPFFFLLGGYIIARTQRLTAVSSNSSDDPCLEERRHGYRHLITNAGFLARLLIIYA